MAQTTQKRISQLTRLTDDEVNVLIESTAQSSDWAMAVDYTQPDTTEGGEIVPVDQGTKHIPIDRIGLLTESRTVPQSMLPHQMDEIYDGTMEHTGNPDKWTFTVSSPVEHAGEVYVCPKPTAGSGELRPTINVIYRDVSLDGAGDTSPIYTQYRYVPVDNADVGTADEEGSFVPIPSDLVMVNGEATNVHDDNIAYTRQVDLVIGDAVAESAASGQEKSIFISGNKLVHASQPAITPGGVYPGGPASQSPGFGDSFNLTSFTVNKTGHITGTTVHTVYMPKTAASSDGTTQVQGLVKIGTTSTWIGEGGASAPSAGTTEAPVNGYVEVAAADHVHTAKNLTFSNVSDVNTYPAGQLIYNGSTDRTYDFYNILKATLPAAPASGSNNLLLVSMPSGNTRQAVWQDVSDVVHPEYLSIPVASSVSCSASVSVVQWDTSSASYDHTGAIAAGQSAFTGLNANKVYIVCLNFGFTPSAANTSMEDVIVRLEAIDSSASGAQWTQVENGNATFALDGSITGVPNYLNGNIVFQMPGNKDSIRVTLQTGSPAGTTYTWGVTGNIQIAEVK